jgi:hypothetical protein
MIAGVDAIDASQPAAGQSGGADAAHIQSVGVTVPTPRGRWFVAVKWGRDRRASAQGPAPEARPPEGPPSLIHHPLSRAWLVAFATSFAIAAACFGVLAYALILE